MEIFKFGGASIKNSEGIKNVTNILKHKNNKTLVVISAIGKMTNAFENIINSYYTNKNNELKNNISFVKESHNQIINDLFTKNHKIHNEVNLIFEKLNNFITTNTIKNYNYIYDQIVGTGEILSTTIVSNYLQEIGVDNNLLDVRKLIKTDNTYRDAKVKWQETEKNIKQNINTNKLNITQGFLGGNNNITTTLGREGSDYTASIFAYCLNAKKVTIWKDVDGVLNADPRYFEKTELLKNISYTEAIEMAFYGASVIHPKTIQPLQQKNIPLFVRSFKNIENEGTCVSNNCKEITNPCFIVKENQVLISISPKDFSFIMENNISFLFNKLHQHSLKVNLIQNSAISFSVCVNDKFLNFENFYNDLKNSFNIKFNKNVTLYTIRHYNSKAIENISKKGKILIKQINTKTAQLII